MAANQEEPYQIIPAGVVTTDDDSIFVAINYIINETVAGANVNGLRRLAVCKITYSSSTLALNVCRYY